MNVKGGVNSGYKITYYSVKDENLHTTANGTKWNGKNMRVHDNKIQYKDSKYGWCTVYAVNIDTVKKFGTGKAAVYNSKLHGTIMEVNANGTKEYGIVLDACGAARNKPIIDRWVYKAEKNNITNVSFKVVRCGW